MSLASTMLAELSQNLSGWDSAVYNGATIYGIFGNEYVEVLGVESKRPVFECKTSDVSGAVQDSVLVITSELHAVTAVSYTVVNVQPAPEERGPGVIRLVLKKS
jgi:hypothetical protein